MPSSPFFEPMANLTRTTDGQQRLLQVFYLEGQKALRTLERCYDECDWTSYALCAHALKGSSASLGYHNFAALALAMELAGKNDDGLAIARGHAEFTAQLEALLTQQGTKCNALDDTSYTDVATQADKASLQNALAELRAVIANYDADAIDTALDELRRKRWSAAVRERLDTLAQHLLMFDYRAALITLDTLEQVE